MRFARIDQSPVARWWWTVDRWSFAALCVLIGFGVVMCLAASPAVAERIGYDGVHFVRRYLALVPVALALMFVVSLQTPRTVRRIAVVGLRDRARAAGPDLRRRRRDQGRAALDRPAAAVAAALRIRQADLRRGRRLAASRAESAARLSRQPDRDCAVAGDRRDADQAARSRHGGGRRRGVVRAVLPGRPAALLGGARRDRRGRWARRRLSRACRT